MTECFVCKLFTLSRSYSYLILQTLFLQILNHYHLMIFLWLSYFSERQANHTTQSENLPDSDDKVLRLTILISFRLIKMLISLRLILIFWKDLLKVKRECILNFSHKLTLKNKGKSWSCSVTAVEKDLPALAMSHFNTVWRWVCRISLCYPLDTTK